ncbi:MAG TPA: hypothetical protein VGK32_00465 [Vicinamibacterales bacterium]|jgi:spermidine synthase
MRLFLTGALSLVAQIVLLRELNVAFYGVELVYLLALATWMAGTATGAALVGRRDIDRGPSLSWLLAVSAVALPAMVALVRSGRVALGAVQGAYLPFDRQLLLLLASMLPLSMALGLAFRWAASAASIAGVSLALAYGIESLGAAFGGLAATLAFRAGVQTLALAVGVAGVVPAIVILESSVDRRVRSRTAIVVVVGLLLTTPLALAWSASVDRRMTAWSHPTVVDTRDSPYARITVTASAGQVSVFENDVLTFESETAENEELAHLGALQHAAPRRMLLLGGRISAIDRQLARHAPERLDVVEIDRVLVDVAERQLGIATESVREIGDRVGPTRLWFEDPRTFITRPATYDLIVVAAPEPSSGQTNRFFTEEFFRACRRRLAPDGVLALRLPLSENLVTRQALLRTASVVRAIRPAFATVDVLPASGAIVVASRATLPSDVEVLVARLASRHLGTRLITPAYLRYVYENDRRADLAARLEQVPARANSDVRPVCYQYTAVLWLTQFFPSLTRLDLTTWSSPDRWPPMVQFVIVAVVLGVTLAVRVVGRARPYALAFVAGFAGMLLETVGIFDYQARRGALFEDLGFLVMAFMVGLSAGAWAAGRWRAERQASAGRRLALAGLGALAATGLLMAWLVAGGIEVSLLTTALLLLLAGTAASLVFASATRYCFVNDGAGRGVLLAPPAGNPAGTVSPGDIPVGGLYAADLAGGCLAALVASVVLMPLAGLVTTAWLVAGVAGLALVLV